MIISSLITLSVLSYTTLSFNLHEEVKLTNCSTNELMGSA